MSERGEGADRSYVVFLAGEEDFATLGGAAFLDQAWTSGATPATKAPTIASLKPKPPKAAANPPAEKQTRYEAPLSYDDVKAWPEDGLWRRLAPADAASPRHRIGVMTKESAKSHATALRDFAKGAGVDITGSVKLEPLESWAGYDGRDVRILLTETRFAGGDGVLFLFLSRGKGNSHISVFAVEMTAATYRDWTAVARMLVLRGVIKSVDVYPPKRLEQIVAAPLREQMALYEATLDKLYRVLVIGMMQTQTQTLMMMQELNYDLLFGNDIGTPGLPD